MSSIFGSIAQGRVAALARQRQEGLDAQRQGGQTLELALAMHRLQNDNEDRNLRLFNNGFVPDGGGRDVPTAPANGQPHETPAPSQSPSTSPIKGYRYDPNQTSGIRQKVATRKAEVKGRTDNIRNLDPSVSDATANALANNDGLYDAWVKQKTGVTQDPRAVHRANRDYDVAHPVNGEDNPGVRARAGFGAVDKQLKDTQAQIKARTPKALNPLLASHADSTAYNQKMADVGPNSPLGRRADSLSTVRDRLAAEVQGRSSPATAPAKDTVEAQDEYDHLRETMTDAQIAKKYNIAPTVRRKK